MSTEPDEQGAIALLDSRQIAFPPTHQAHPSGLLAVGGSLSPNWLLAAYQHGIFPWFNDDQPILWWSPNPRCVIFPDQLHISRSLSKLLRRKLFRLTFNTAFEQVIDACRAPRVQQDSPGSWITDNMRQAYIRLHQLKLVHSIEVWQDDDLVGGLYGLSLGRVFFAESMFHRASNASKVALVYLAGQLCSWGCSLIDCQVTSPHLLSLGAIELPRHEFECYLQAGLVLPPFKDPWILSWNPVH